MKITSSTSITSMRGTMLISAAGVPDEGRSKLPKAMKVSWLYQARRASA
jgi:hypothetical protein